MNDDFNTSLAKSLVEQTAGKTYEDVAHPGLEATGKVLSFVPRTIRAWLSKWEKWLLNSEYSLKETEKILADKLKDIPEEKIVEPEPYVVIPALQQLSYSLDSEELRELYANLLASAMDKDFHGKIHPAFVDIIKQFAPDEAKLLRYMSHQEVLPAIEIRLKGGKGYILLNKCYMLIPNGTLDIPENLSLYIENLCRLQLIEIPADAHYATEDLYYSLENQTHYYNITKDKLTFERKVIRITEFGRYFIEVCV